MVKYKTDSFLGSGYKTLDVKYVFDHLRNIGISSAIAVGGVALSNNEVNVIFKSFEHAEFMGAVVIVFSALLFVLNFVQFIYVASSLNTGIARFIAAIMIIPIYVITFSSYLSYFIPNI